MQKDGAELPPAPSPDGFLHVEAEVDHVAVLDHILLALAAELALLLGGVGTAVLDHIIIGDHRYISFREEGLMGAYPE